MEILDNEEILEVIETTIKGFDGDPADSPFQQGFLAGMAILHEQITGSRADWITNIVVKSGLSGIERVVTQ